MMTTTVDLNQNILRKRIKTPLALKLSGPNLENNTLPETNMAPTRKPFQ